jgi:acyl CoA:acetate/3-ketoacid CoA transferase
MAKIVDAADAVAQIADRSVVSVACSSGVNLPESTLAALGSRFQAMGGPVDLTVVLPINAGDMFGLLGVDHLAAPGLVRRLIGGSFTSGPSRLPVPAMRARIAAGDLEAYNLPSGWLYQLHREIAARRPGVFTDVGIGTFVDPRHGGGRMNAVTHEHLVHVVKFDGREWLHLPSFGVDWAIIRATTADERGNLSFEHEASTTGAYVQALAAHNSGGRVIAQVERIAAAGTLPPQTVRVPGVLVDYVVVDPAPQQATQTAFDPAISGEVRRPLASVSPVPFGPEKVIVRRAVQELRRGMTVNLGYGISALAPAVLLEEGQFGDVTFAIEQGAIGGLPLTDYQFGCAVNAEAFVSAADQFDFLQGGGCDAAMLSFLQVGPDGSVNVSLLADRPHTTAGAGGFVDITAHTPNLIFSGYFTAGGLEVAVEDGRLHIKKEGRVRKFVEQVAQVTFNGAVAAERGQSLTYVTERAVLRVIAGALTLVELAPGIDVQRDVLDQCDAAVAVAPLLRTMDARLFRPEPTGCSWGDWEKT